MNVRVRMAPSPTGSPHVGLVRTALFNWAFARHNGGQFVLRIEDTDKARNTVESEKDILDLFSWLGLNWDEGPDVGGEHGPYRQSERTHHYVRALELLEAGGYTYPCFCTPDEVKARRESENSKLRGYDGHCRDLDLDERMAFYAADRPAVTRLRMPLGKIEFHDLVRGDMAFDTTSVPDPVLAKADGSPLYTLANPVDDALMGITHVFRGEDLLSSTPRQIPLFEALAAVGMGSGAPQFGHLPYVMGSGNAKLSKRDPEANALLYREAGFIPEGMLNYLALLGWGMSGDRDVFSLQEMADAFLIEDVNANPAKFDLKKAESLNATHLRALAPEEFAERLRVRLVEDGVIGEDASPEDLALVTALAPLVQTRMVKLSEAKPLVENFFQTDDFVVDEDEASKLLNDADAAEVLATALKHLALLSTWDAASIEAVLRSELVDKLGLKPCKAFGAVRLATSGQRISPPLFESMELLGRTTSINRIADFYTRISPNA